MPDTTIDPRFIPASFITAATKDPASAWPDAPPNFGQAVVPHIMTVSGRVSTRAYLWADEALRDSRANADRMRTDCGIMKCVEARQRACALLNWHLAPEDESSHEQKTLADEMTRIIRRTPHFAKLRYSIGEARWYGRTGVALQYGKDWVNGKMRTIVKRWEPRHGDKLVFRYDDGTGESDPDQVGIRIGGAYGLPSEVTDITGQRRNKIEGTAHGLVYWLDAWERKTMIVNKHIIEDGPWEDPQRAGAIHGVGIRDRIYWNWYGMIECLSSVLTYLERSAFGIEIWTYPAGNDQARQRTEAAAKGVQSNGKTVLIVPKFQGENADDFGVQVIEPGMGGLDAAMSIITDFFGHKQKRYILGQTLTSEAAATGLGSGVADAHMATFADIIKMDAVGDEETLTTDLVRNLQLWNFPKSRGVYLRFVIDTESPDAQGKMAGYKSAWDMGARIKEEDVLSTIGAAMPKATDKVLINPAIANQQQADMGQPGGPMGQGGDDLQHLFGPLAGLIGGQEGEAGPGGQPPPGGPPGQPPNGKPPNGQPSSRGPTAAGGQGPEQFAGDAADAADIEKYAQRWQATRGRKQLESSPGQVPLIEDVSDDKGVIWREELHPRDPGGQWATKGSGHIKSSFGQSVLFSELAAKVHQAEADVTPRGKQRQEGLFRTLAESNATPEQVKALLSGDHGEVETLKEIAEHTGQVEGAKSIAAGTGARRALPGGMKKVEAAQETMRDAIRGEHADPRARADAIAAAREGVGGAMAEAHSGKQFVDPDDPDLPARAAEVLKRIPKVSAAGMAKQLGVSEEEGARLLDQVRGSSPTPAAEFDKPFGLEVGKVKEGRPDPKPEDDPAKQGLLLDEMHDLPGQKRFFGGEEGRAQEKAAATKPRELSDQEKTDVEYAENFNQVSADPPKAKSRSLHRAIGFMHQEERRLKRRLDRGDITPEAFKTQMEGSEREREWYARLLKERGDYAGGGPYSDEIKHPGDPNPSPARKRAMDKQRAKAADFDQPAKSPSSWKKNEDGTYTAANGTIWKKAAAGGEVSPVTGERFEGGRLMPIHGLHQKPEVKPKPQAKGMGSSAGKPNENKERRPVQAMTPEQIVEAKERQENERKWSETKAGHVGELLGMGDRPHYLRHTDGGTKRWERLAESANLTPEQVKQLADHFQEKAVGDIREDIAGKPVKTHDGRTLTTDEAIKDYLDHAKLVQDGGTNYWRKKWLKSHPDLQRAQHFVGDYLSKDKKPQGDRLHELHTAIDKLKRGESLGEAAKAKAADFDAPSKPIEAPAQPVRGVHTSPDELPYETAMRAHSGTSFVPEKRAKQRQEEFAETLNSDYDALAKLAKTDEERKLLDDEFARYKAGYKEKTLAYLHASSRVVSTMIAGPSKFPTRQMEKRGDSMQKRLNELIEFRKRARAAIGRKIRPEEHGIKSADPNAVESLQSKLAEHEKVHERMKSMNAVLRGKIKAVAKGQGEYEIQYRGGATYESLKKSIMEAGFSDKMAASALKPDYMGRVGFPDYAIKNNGAEIRRIKSRIESVGSMKASPGKEESYGDVRLVENPEAARIQLVFPGKPDEATRSRLKSAGFRWSPTEGAWQRHLNSAGRSAAEQVLKSLGKDKTE